jgi:hypothetical protein
LPIGAIRKRVDPATCHFEIDFYKLESEGSGINY